MKEARFPDTLAAHGHLRIFLLSQQTEGVVCEREVRSRGEYFHHTPLGWRVRMKKQVEEELSEMVSDPRVRFYLDNNLPLTLELHLGVGAYNYTSILDAGQPAIQRDWKPKESL